MNYSVFFLYFCFNAVCHRLQFFFFKTKRLLKETFFRLSGVCRRILLFWLLDDDRIEGPLFSCLVPSPHIFCDNTTLLALPSFWNLTLSLYRSISVHCVTFIRWKTVIGNQSYTCIVSLCILVPLLWKG